MKLDEFAWFNQQLAAMLRDGLPLAGSLRQLAASMRRGHLRTELSRLESDLGQGIPVDEAVRRRRLPALYVRLLQAGVRGGDLPGALTMAADHFANVDSLWRRTKAVLLYPALLILVGLGLTLLLWKLHTATVQSFHDLLGQTDPVWVQVALLAAPVWFGLAGVALLIVAAMPGIRHWLGWRVPGFREARTAGFAGGMALLLRHGCPLPEALDLMRELERYSPAESDLAAWAEQLARGENQLAGQAASWRGLPPLLAWFLQSSGSDLAEGFKRAAAFYQERARHRLDLLLHGSLPLMLLFLGLMTASQLVGVMRTVVVLVDSLGTGT